MDCSIVMITQAKTDVRLNLLAYTIASLRKHTTYPFRFIVVDNGDKEQTDYLRTQDIDIHIVNKVNQGMGRPRNQGAALADTEYVVFIDNDLSFSAGWLSASIKILKEYPNEKIIVCPLKTNGMKDVKKHSKGRLGDFTLWQKAGSGTLVFRRKDYEEIGLFSEVGEVGREYSARAYAQGYHYLLTNPGKVKHRGKQRTWPRTGLCVAGDWYVRNNKVILGE